MDAANDFNSNLRDRAEAESQGEVGASLAGTVARIKERLATIAVEAMRARYELGAFVYSTRVAEHHASSAEVLRRLAKIFEMHTTALRRCGRVAEVYPREDFEALLALRSDDRMPMTWSHVELLTEVADRDVRRQLEAEVTAEALSVRALSARIRSRRKPGLAA